MGHTVEILLPHDHDAPREVDADRYEAVKRALLTVIPRDPESVPNQTLAAAVQGHVSPALIDPESINRWVVDVRLDLEARGVLEAVHFGGRPSVRRRR